jgi:imidazolonepropionase-like amidohydrolase
MRLSVGLEVHQVAILLAMQDEVRSHQVTATVIELKHLSHSLEGAVKFVAASVASGADYIKIMIEEGSILKAPGLPMMSKDTVQTAITEAHKHGKLAIARVLTYDATKEAIKAGMHGLAHVFIDKPRFGTGQSCGGI